MPTRQFSFRFPVRPLNLWRHAVGILALALLSWVLPVLAQPAISLPRPTLYPAGGNPYAVAIGDLNGDSIPDIASAHQSASFLRVYFGNGDGTLKAGTEYPIGGTSQALAVGHFNADSALDILTANLSTNTLSLLIADGNGGFLPAVSFSSGHGISLDLLSADLNGDGKTDAAVPNDSASSITLFLGDAAGGFYTNYSVAVQLPPVSIASADLNQDGNLDIVAAPGTVAWTSTAGFSVLLGDGRGAFSHLFEPAGSQAERLQKITLADLDADGKPDLIVATSTRGLGIFRGIGDGRFTVLTNFTAGPTDGYRSTVVSDFNGDDFADIIVAANTGPILLTGLGGGKFARTFLDREWRTGAASRTPAVGDLNGDGRPDLILPLWDSARIGVSLNQTPPILRIESLGIEVRLWWPNWNFEVEFSDSLREPKWQKDLSPAARFGTRRTLTNTMAPPSRFYRLVYP